MTVQLHWVKDVLLLWYTYAKAAIYIVGPYNCVAPRQLLKENPVACTHTHTHSLAQHVHVQISLAYLCTVADFQFNYLCDCVVI